MRPLKGLALLLAVVVVAACGPSKASNQGRGIAISPGNVQLSAPATSVREGQPATSGRKSAAGCAATQPAPVLPVARTSDRNLAIVTLRGSDGFVVRDITDLANPTTLFTYPELSGPQFISAFELASVSYVDQNKLVRAAIDGRSSSIVATGCDGMIAFAWSPDATAAAYVTDLEDRSGSQLHIISRGLNSVVSSMPALPWGVGCESADCADRVDFRLLYSPDGAYLSLVQSWGGPVLRIWKADSTQLMSIDSPGSLPLPTMSVWSGDTLYYRDDNGVESWRAGSSAAVLPHVLWIRPKAAPGGGSIVYEARDASGMPNVYLLDTATRQTKLIAKARSEPAFLTSRYLWWQGERPCTAQDNSGYGCNHSIPTGTTYVYDLQSGTESVSNITHLWDIWPHPA